ncbi:endonuclease MutS2 [Defluviitalea phaphyphila]|uniref:endonuclease MutS2 n=1 Tax=Defluviitalea phaphyphila TaxID=1473580 RepID=UPI0007319D3E|nr:endonuclease MutS2 [Defluviitalea phaphyphila]
MEEKTLKTLEYDKIIEKLANYAVSPMAKEIIMNLKPSSNYNKIIKMQKETSDAVSMILRKGSIPLGGFKDVRNALKRVKIGGILSATELLYIADLLRVCRKVKNYYKDERKQESYETLNSLFEEITPLPTIENEISRCIISEEEIADEASTTLYNIRREIKLVNEKIKEQLQKIIHSHANQSMLQEAVITIRGDRYCVPVKQEYRSQFPGIIHDQSSTGATLFIEPISVVNINNSLRELQVKENAEIEKILSELTAMVEENLEIIILNIELLTKLDFIFSKAQLALEMKAIEPKFNQEGRIVIKKARHPLLDPNTVVPIDIYLGDKFTTLLITGPNTGGKTVSLKTLGLFTLMGQAGLHIPAFDNSELAVFDEVFADIGDEQSIEQSLSTFSSHMTNIVHILKKVTPNSLVLFDELGAGTDPTEGAALAMAILDYLLKMKVRTAATTHYSELKIYALSTEGIENASSEFDIETLKPTYKLLIGIPGKSNAFSISKRLGLPEFIIEEANKLIAKEDKKFEDLIMDLEISKKTAIYEQNRAAQYRREAEELKKRLEKQKEKLESQREKLILEAKQEARKILQEAKEEADKIIKELQRSAREAQIVINQKDMEEARGKLRKKLGDIEEELTKAVLPKKTLKKLPKNLKKGDRVFITSLNQNGIVVIPPDNNGDVTVQAGIMKIKVHLSNLALDETEEKEKQKSSVSTIGAKRSKSISIKTEIDLRGQMTDEAIINTEKYLDDAYLSNLSQVTIIHGKGTGALRTAIHKLLKRHPHVKSYRLGKYGEGETGVTIVELD